MFHFIHVALNILILFSFTLTASAKTGIPYAGPQREVISIYNDNFTTPKSRVPYFIEVYRCVKAGQCSSGQYSYPVPANKTEIEIVVPDLTNNYRDPDNKPKFYKYVVYNHTSCKCGKTTGSQLQYKKNASDVSEAYFNKTYAKNPPNLLRQCNHCSSPQQRYKLHPSHHEAFPDIKYLPYKQCLPGCLVKSNKSFTLSSDGLNGKLLNVPLINDTSCVAYDAPPAHNTTVPPPPGPQKEVISIYNDEFTTPESRVPYFIEVYRCVKVEKGGCNATDRKLEYPVPASKTEIEIVVPDLTNNVRDPGNQKFYKYVVYNHTSCKCGNKTEIRKPNEEITTVENFEEKYVNNPPNLFSQCNYCNSPQPRYKLHPEHKQVVPDFKYLAYRQCLPGCVATNTNITNTTTEPIDHGAKIIVPLENDNSCEAYDPPPANTTTKTPSQIARVPPMSGNLQKRDSFNKESGYEMLVYIGSTKLILAAFLLSLVLFTILIMDFTLCRRKKGFLYALVGCNNNDKDNSCQHCAQRNRNEITVV